MSILTAEQWKHYHRTGYLSLGKVLSDDELAALSRRIDQIMLGTASVDYKKMLMQLDSDSGRYEDAKPQTAGHKGATLNYRKIEQLEFDPMFLELMQRPVYREICERVYGRGTSISAFRAMFMNKPAHKGTFLPWHQDRWSHLDRDPLVTIWTALDDATIANGCVQVIPGTHALGLINPDHGSGFLTAEQVRDHVDPARIVYIEVKAGESFLLHNWLLHASDVNKTDNPRRAFSVCYMDARTATSRGATFPVIFGEGALDPAKLPRGNSSAA